MPRLSGNEELTVTGLGPVSVAETELVKATTLGSFKAIVAVFVTPSVREAGSEISGAIESKINTAVACTFSSCVVAFTTRVRLPFLSALTSILV